MREGESRRSVTVGRPLPPVRPVAIKEASREAAASRAPARDVDVDVDAEAVVGAMVAVARARSREVARVASAAAIGLWRR